jgi:hypothetical protein
LNVTNIFDTGKGTEQRRISIYGRGASDMSKVWKINRQIGKRTMKVFPLCISVAVLMTASLFLGCVSNQSPDTYQVDAVNSVSAQEPVFDAGQLAQLASTASTENVINHGANSADDFIQGWYCGYHFGSIINWNLPGVTDPTVQYNFQSMFWLDACVQAWKKTGDVKYVKKAIPNLMNWLNRFTVMKNTDPAYTWGDDSTGRRGYIICNTYTLWQKYFTTAQKNIIKKSMDYHAKLLADNKLYTWQNNHGLFRDRALVMYTITFTNKLNSSYRSLAKSRIMDYMENKVFADGTTAEHSSGYHVTIASLCYTMSDLFVKIDPAFCKYLTKAGDKLADFEIQVTRPDGSIAPLGDTVNGTKFIPMDRWNNNKQYLYVLSKGAKGVKPTVTDKIYPDGNYAVFRDSWNFNSKSNWILFDAATHSAVHKQHDDLSFMIWHHGDLFSDGGFGGYDYVGSAMARYATSPWAHSVLISDWLEKSTHYYYTNIRPVMNSNSLKTKITASNINGSTVWVEGKQCYIPTITQTRRLTWDKTKNVVTLDDVVTSQFTITKSKADYHMFLFHLASDIKPVVSKNTVTLMRGNKKEATMTFKASQTFVIRTYLGAGDSLIQGFNAYTGKASYVLGVYFKDVRTTLKLKTTINLLP